MAAARCSDLLISIASSRVPQESTTRAFNACPHARGVPGVSSRARCSRCDLKPLLRESPGLAADKPGSRRCWCADRRRTCRGGGPGRCDHGRTTRDHCVWRSAHPCPEPRVECHALTADGTAPRSQPASQCCVAPHARPRRPYANASPGATPNKRPPHARRSVRCGSVSLKNLRRTDGGAGLRLLEISTPASAGRSPNQSFGPAHDGAETALARSHPLARGVSSVLYGKSAA